MTGKAWAISSLMRARTVADVDRALDRWIEPVNVVHAADSCGALLHRVAGYVPVRHRDNWLRIVPAWQQEHDWQGRHGTPRAEVDGIAVMANARGLAAPLGVEFAPPHRADRIDALLRESQDWTAQGMTAIHMVRTSRPRGHCWNGWCDRVISPRPLSD